MKLAICKTCLKETAVNGDYCAVCRPSSPSGATENEKPFREPLERHFDPAFKKAWGGGLKEDFLDKKYRSE